MLVKVNRNEARPFNLLTHAARRLWSWLISDVGPKMTPHEIDFVSQRIIASALGRCATATDEELFAKVKDAISDAPEDKTMHLPRKNGRGVRSLIT